MSALLPPPRLPLSGNKPSADTIASVVGEDLVQPLRERDEIGWEAQDALADLMEHRPGGAAWAEALAADREQALAEKHPKTYATERLLAQDAHRWAHASALCRSVTERQREAVAGLDTRAIAAAAWAVMGEAEARWTEAVVQAWTARETKAPKSRMLASYEDAEAARAEWSLAAQVWRAYRGTGKPRNQDEADALVAVGYGFPGGPVGRRWWLMSNEQRGVQPLTIPAHVTESEVEARLTAAGRSALASATLRAVAAS